MNKPHTENHGATENAGNATNVDNPKASGEVEKANPQDGTTTTGKTGNKPAKR